MRLILIILALIADWVNVFDFRSKQETVKDIPKAITSDESSSKALLAELPVTTNVDTTVATTDAVGKVEYLKDLSIKFDRTIVKNI